MDITTVILNAAKLAKVSGILLLAICSHESNDFTMNYAPHDHGSPSYGICQLKEDSARQVGFQGNSEELMNPKVNAKYSALYLAYEQSRYGEDDWCVLTAAYNAGSYNESKRQPGYPMNLKYVRLVQRKIPNDFKYKMSCVKNE